MSNTQPFQSTPRFDIPFETLQMCSGHLLADNYPDNWESMTHEEQKEFIRTHEWEFMEGACEEWMMEQIENIAWATQKFINLNYVSKGAE